MQSLNATAIDIRFDPEEDRLAFTLRTETDSVFLQMTRRLTRMMLGGIVDLLMRTNGDMASTPAASRNDVLLFEHMSAATSWEREMRADGPAVEPVADFLAGPEPSVSVAAAQSWIMARKLDLTIVQGGMRFVFHGAEGECGSIELSRGKAHQLLSIILERTIEAQWDLQELFWLHRRTHIVVPDGLHLC
jgi:hypothetical protein